MKRTAFLLSAGKLVVYCGAMDCFAFANAIIGQQIVPGLTVGLLAGPGVIVIGVALSFLYVTLANRHESQGTRP